MLICGFFMPGFSHNSYTPRRVFRIFAHIILRFVNYYQ